MADLPKVAELPYIAVMANIVTLVKMALVTKPNLLYNYIIWPFLLL